MEIINSEFRENVISYCCQKDVYLDSIECSGCLEQTTFLIKEPTAFHKYLIENCKEEKEPIKFLVELLRKMIIDDQNQMVFELMDWVDIGDPQYNRATLERVAIMVLDTNFVTNRIDAVNSIPNIKQINNNKNN